MFMNHLKQTGKPVDDYQNKTNSAPFLTGAYFIVFDGVPGADWQRDGRQARLNRDNPDVVGEVFGVHCAVRG